MSEINANASVSSGHRPMGFPEFVVIIASIMALNPLAMDMMLPALPNIRSAFHLADAEPPADGAVDLPGRLRRRPVRDGTAVRPLRPPAVLLGGMTVYFIASLLAIAAPSFETLLLARALQGLGTSATRVIATSIVRDCYAGRRMASVMSLAMMVFIAVPVIAPSFGQAVLLLTQWRGIFIVLMVYGVVTLIWSAWRMPETLPSSCAARWPSVNIRRLPPDRDQPADAWLCAGRWRRLGCCSHSCSRRSRCSPRFTSSAHYFPIAFASIAIGTAIAGFVNARFVNRLGMRVISHAALLGYVTVSGIMLAAVKLQMLPLPLFMALSALMMFSFGLMIANFTALAMEPQGHIAGTASSLYGSITTLLGIGIGTTIGQDYDGTLLPFATGFFLCTLASLGVVLAVEKGRLFRSHQVAGY